MALGVKGGLAALLVASAMVASHWAYIEASDCNDSDVAVVLLMARHLAAGEPAFYYWQQRYMVAVEPALLAPLAAAGQLTHRSAAWFALLITAAHVGLAALLARRWGGRALLAALLVAIPPACVAGAQVTVYGARLVATALALLALVVASGSWPWRYRWAGAGALIGIAMAMDHVMLCYGLGLAVLAWSSEDAPARAIGRRHVPAAALQLVLWAAPFVILELVVGALFAEGGFKGPTEPWLWPRTVAAFVLAVLPRLLGADRLAAGFELHPSAIEPGSATGVYLRATVVFLVALSAAVLLLRSLRLSDRRLRPLWAVVAGAIGIFFLGAADAMGYRYLVPAWPVMSVLLSVGAARVRGGVVLGAALLAAFAFSIANDPLKAHGAQSGAACREEAARVDAALSAHGIDAVRADYWDAYRLALLLSERLPFALTAGTDRRPQWTAQVAGAHHVAVLVRAGESPPPSAATEGSRVRVGIYDLLLPQ